MQVELGSYITNCECFDAKSDTSFAIGELPPAVGYLLKATTFDDKYIYLTPFCRGMIQFLLKFDASQVNINSDARTIQ